MGLPDCSKHHEVPGDGNRVAQVRLVDLRRDREALLLSTGKGVEAIEEVHLAFVIVVDAEILQWDLFVD